jgi:hypothetical protein
MKQFPVIYNQNDYIDLLGNSTVNTIKSSGCFLTSGAIKLGYYGITITPPDLNKLLIQKGLYSNSDLLSDNWISSVYPEVKYLKTFDYEPIPTDLQNIASLLSDPAITLTIRINLGGGNLHFVEAVNCDGTTLHIANPISGMVEDFSQRYGNPVTANLHVLVYTGVVPQPVAPITPSPLATNFNNAITKSNNFDKVCDFLGISQQARVTTTSGQDVVTLIQQLQLSLHNEEEYAHKLELQVAGLTNTKPIGTVTATPPPTGAVFAGGLPPVSGTTPPVVPDSISKASGLPVQSKPNVKNSQQNLFSRIIHILFA